MVLKAQWQCMNQNCFVVRMLDLEIGIHNMHIFFSINYAKITNSYDYDDKYIYFCIQWRSYTILQIISTFHNCPLYYPGRQNDESFVIKEKLCHTSHFLYEIQALTCADILEGWQLCQIYPMFFRLVKNVVFIRVVAHISSLLLMSLLGPNNKKYHNQSY